MNLEEKIKRGISEDESKAVQEIPEMIEFSINGIYQENLNEKQKIDANGKKYLYDIINIKKEPSNPLS